MNETPNGKRVVVIDDEEDVRLYLTAALLDEGYDVQSAATGREGLAFIRQERPDLVCLDLVMPGQTGLATYRRLREEPELLEVPVLIISGLGVEKSIGEVLEGLPAPEGYLEKPIEPRRLLDTVRCLIRDPEEN